jgi:lariat debranching enzyme
MVRVAIEGCCHGDLDKIYATIEHAQQVAPDKKKIDLLICCGDFQSVRNEIDLSCLHTPPQYREYKDFYQYYSGEKKAPIPTLFIGGNHEASNYLRELYYGGYVAPNIYYLGHTGVVNFKGLRIAGGSGIYKVHDYWKNRQHETLPYNESSIRSAYHIRHYEIYKLYQLKDTPHIDIFLSHDWPTNITNYGDVENLLRWKQHFRQDIENQQLGSPASEKLLHDLRPSYWFSGHMHCKFAALVKHENSDQLTKFLALDKCLPKRSFLQVLDIEPNSGTASDDDNFYYDLDWLATTRITNSKMNNPTHTFGSRIYDLKLEDKDQLEKEKSFVTERLTTFKDGKYSSLCIRSENFVRNAPVYDPNGQFTEHNQSVASWNYMEAKNPQTSEFLEMLDLPDLISFQPKQIVTEAKNEEEIELDL